MVSFLFSQVNEILHILLYSCILLSGKNLGIALSKCDHGCDVVNVRDCAPNSRSFSVLL